MAALRRPGTRKNPHEWLLRLSPMDAASAITSDRSRFYDTIADDFDTIMNMYDLRRRVEIVFDELLTGLQLRGLRVLDAGCGTGPFSIEADRRGARVTSLDIGAKLLAITRRKCRTACVQASADAISARDGSFDVVISSECVEHTPDPRRSIDELVRVCRPGGRIVITCPNRTWHWAIALANWLGVRPYDGLENWPSTRELRTWVEQSGARVLRQIGFHLVPFVLGPLNPLLRPLDRGGSAIPALFVNQAILAERA